MLVLLVSFIVLVNIVSGFVLGPKRISTSPSRLTTGNRSFADSFGSFNHDCGKIIEASRTGNRAAIRKILSRYSRSNDIDAFEILRMHSLINASRYNDKAVVEYLVEEFGADPMAHNSIAMKEAVRSQSLDVLTYMLEHKYKPQNE